MYNKKELKVTPKAEGKKNPYKKDIIYDPMGQWAHPGEVTRIPSGDITMQGVPYPVMGIDNFGNVQMMMPGQDYSFPGDIVDEYPMAKKGGVPRSLKKMYTSKNIQSSINEILMKRNNTLFGHSGRRYYKPMQDGGDYNMQRALELGYNPDETEHWPSVDSETGMWLKSKNHPTAWKEFMYGQLNADLAKNLDVRVNPEGYFGDNQLQYVPKKQDGGWLDEFQNGGPLTINKDLNQAFMRGEGRPVVIQPVHPKTMAEAQLIEDIKAKQALAKESNDKALYKKAKADGMTHNQAVAYVEMQNNPEEFFDQGTISQGRDPQSGVGKFLEVAANPFLAMREKTRHGHIPDYMSKNTDNEWYSPTSVADMLYQATAGAPFAVANAAWNVPANLTEGDYIGAGLNALDAFPVIPNVGNYVKKGKDLIKSQRFVPDPNAYYRGIGKEGYKDAILNQAIKAKDPKAFHSPYFTKAGDFDVAKHFNPDIIVEAKGKKLTDDLSQLDANDLVFARSNMGTVSVNHSAIPNLDPYGNLGGDVFSVGVDNIPLDNPNIRVLKKHWLKGYKEVDVPSQLPGSPNVAKAALPNPLAILDRLVPSVNPFSFIADGGDLTSISPLNWMPGYGKSLKGEGKAYRKFGNDLSHVLETGTLSPKGGSKLRIGRGTIVNEGNWAALDKPWEKYPGVFTAEFDFKKPGSNLGYINPSKRNGVLITDAEKGTLPDIPVSDPGLEFHRRLPFSTRYIPLDKEKILAGKFQLGQAGSHLQSLAEKYGRGLGLIGTAGAVTGQGEEAIKWYNDHTVNPIIEAIKEGIDDPAGIMDRTKRDWNKLMQKRGGQVDWLSEFE